MLGLGSYGSEAKDLRTLSMGCGDVKYRDVFPKSKMMQ